MQKFSFRTAAAAAAAIMLLVCTGCGDTASSGGASSAAGTSAAESKALEPDVSAAEVSSAADESKPAEPAESQTEQTTSVPEDTSSEEETAAPVPVDPSALEPTEDKYEIDAYGQKLYRFTDEYNNFLKDVTFVGDSVCLGLEMYDYLPENNVLANGSVAARNIFDFTFTVNGGEYSITDAVSILKPKILIFWMGINDINLTTSEQFCENYIGLLDKVHEVVPDTKLYIASSTPSAADCEKINNAKLQEYNAALKQALADSGKGYGFIEIGKYLKDAGGALAAEYNGGDGVHLMSHAYSAVLYQVCEQLVGPVQ